MPADDSRYATVLAALDAGVVIHGPDTSILEANSRAHELLGLQRLEGRVAEDPEWVLLDQDMQPLALNAFPVVRAIAGQEVRRDIVIVRRADGSLLWAEVNALPRFDEAGRLLEVAVTFIDVTDRERRHQATVEMNRDLAHLAITDPLTGLINRRGIFEEAERARVEADQHSTPLTVLMLDFDDFKMVNDTYGHQRGDELLVDAAGCIRGQLRADDSAGRIGGDEFLILLPGTAAGDARPLAERIREATEQAAASCAVPVSLSVGAASLRAGEPITEVVFRADRALYVAKRDGGSRVVVDT